MAKGDTNFLRENRKFLTTIQNGGFFKTIKEGEPFLIGFANHIVFDAFEEDWHKINAAFFYNFYEKTFHIDETCGCMSTSRAVRPNVSDLNFLKKKLAERKATFNRKTNKVLFYYDNVRKR